MPILRGRSCALRSSERYIFHVDYLRDILIQQKLANYLHSTMFVESYSNRLGFWSRAYSRFVEYLTIQITESSPIHIEILPDSPIFSFIPTSYAGLSSSRRMKLVIVTYPALFLTLLGTFVVFYHLLKQLE